LDIGPGTQTSSSTRITVGRIVTPTITSSTIADQPHRPPL
ncbi:MAG: hypothetical protein ACI9MR_004540, partial [Myxococcota bacterium]